MRILWNNRWAKATPSKAQQTRKREISDRGHRPWRANNERMLVLTRKVQQSIVIGDNIEVVVLEVRGEQVRIGIKAPKDVPVHRKEIYEQIHEGGESPAQP